MNFGAAFNVTGLAASLWPFGFGEEWRFVQGPENHDIVYQGREPRVARLGDPGNPRSWCQVFNFAVPLFIFLSGVLAGGSTRAPVPLGEYFRGRLLRMLPAAVPRRPPARKSI